MLMDTRRHVATAAVVAGGALALLLSTGCSNAPPPEKNARVTGTIRWRGQPVLDGTITVFSDAGAFDNSPIDNGHYVLSRAPIGTVHVVLTGTTERKDPKQMEAEKWAQIKKGAERMKKWEAEGKSLKDLPPEPVPEDPKGIPSKYSGDRSTPLTREVKAGNQVIDIDIAD